MSTTTPALWDLKAIRRAMLVLGGHPSRVNESQELAHALRLTHDILVRRGITSAEMFQIPGTMPLLVAGNGPILVITYLDDSHPLAQVHDGSPPTISDDLASGPGVTRKAGVLAALGAILEDVARLDDLTLVVETDRHAGSIALESWLRKGSRRVELALCEVSDLPVPAPATFLASTGLVTLRITLRSENCLVEDVFSGVLPDTGQELADTLAALKSRDAEVLVPGFYDGVTTPDRAGMEQIQAVGSDVGAWLARGGTSATDPLRSNHLTLGVFCAPSITIREMYVPGAAPFMPREAHAVIDIRVMPGQGMRALINSIGQFIKRRIPGAEVDPLLVRPPATGKGLEGVELDRLARMLPIAPGNSPAGLIEDLGIPTLGFSTVARNPSMELEQVSLRSIVSGSRLVQDISRAMLAAVVERRSCSS